MMLVLMVLVSMMMVLMIDGLDDDHGVDDDGLDDDDLDDYVGLDDDHGLDVDGLDDQISPLWALVRRQWEGRGWRLLRRKRRKMRRVVEAEKMLSSPWTKTNPI